MKLTIIGAGYIGLVTGAVFSKYNNEVICTDIDVEKVSQLKRAKIPIYEPGLDSLLTQSVLNGRLTFSSDVHQSIAEADIVFITVITPQVADGSRDLSYVMATARIIGEVLRDIKDEEKIIVLKSTVPIGTTCAVEKIISSYFDHSNVVSNPAFLRQGTAVEDFLHSEPVIIGTDCPRAAETLLSLYSPIAADRITVTDSSSAELMKIRSSTGGFNTASLAPSV